MLPALRLTALRSLVGYGRLIHASALRRNDSQYTEAFNFLQSAPPVATPKLEIVSSRSDILHVPPANDPLLQFLTTLIMENGNRAKAAKVVSETLLYIHAYTRSSPMPIVRQAILSASPAVRVMKLKRSGKSLLRPAALNERQRTRIGIRWILNASNGQIGKTLQQRLAKELISVVNGKSSALKNREEMHKTAMVNRGNLPLR